MAGKIIRSPFPTMGESGIPDSFINMSGQRSPYTKLAPRQGPRNSGPDDAGDATHRSAVQIKDAHGPRLAPVTTLYGKNAAEATQTPRRLRLMPSAIGNRDFWGARIQAGTVGPQGGAV